MVDKTLYAYLRIYIAPSHPRTRTGTQKYYTVVLLYFCVPEPGPAPASGYSIQYIQCYVSVTYYSVTVLHSDLSLQNPGKSASCHDSVNDIQYFTVYSDSHYSTLL